MAATMHSRINRRKLDKLNIIRICEEILNPTVPMALRLSGILMGGVVIVYERKVKLLYDDVTRLLVEINEAWKVKAGPSDPTRLPKGKSQAKYNAVTLPENREEDLGEIEQSMQYSDGSTMIGFQQSYIAMRLDNVDEPYLNQNPQGDLNQNYHQVDAANITLVDSLYSHQADTSTFNHFERFDIEDDESQLNFSQPEHTQIPTSVIPSPTPQEEPRKPDEIFEQHPEERVNQKSDERKEANQLDQISQRSAHRRARRPAAIAMDYDQMIIPCHTYQSWLRNSSDIVSKRGRKRKNLNVMPTMKIARLMELPPVVLMEKLFMGNREVHYPAPLLELWMRITQPPHDSPSGRTSMPQPPEASLSTPPERMHFAEPPAHLFEDIHSRIGSQSMPTSIEKLASPEKVHNNVMLPEANGLSASKANLMATPGISGDEIKSIPSSGFGYDFVSHNTEVNSGRSSKKRPYSSSKHSVNSLDTVAEEWHHSDLNLKLARPMGNGFTPDDEELVETGPTQTQQHQIINQALDKITDSMRKQLKTHFDTPGSAKVESLNQLALGMNKKSAACLFYQTCVLATRDDIKVEQKEPYGEILISRGAKM
ncbi:sister chromatid cohesion 1 1 [Olea europaea subsp. europaea]|uniref:Sister chromatid cohesion 1 1 n=1 Tax=Olea europaea subsp. europaea TaxID=158383 RepID=A0A8S0T2B3_OLEEU|nr:sister chromatid cohesion 1 1 [Olea europaea subsp. europaea]